MSEEELEEQLNKTVSVKFILDMLEELDRRREIQKGTADPITGYYSKRAMLKKILKEAGFNYKQYKIMKGARGE